MKNFFITPFWNFQFLFKFSIILTICLGLFSIPSCKDDDPDPVVSTESSISDILNAMGNVNYLKDISSIQYSIQGESFEYEEEEPTHPNPIKLTNYKIDLSAGIANRTLKHEYTEIETEYPVGFSSSDATMIINDREGSISGKHSVTSNYFGAVLPTALYGSRIEANLKNYSMSNPLELIRSYLKVNNDLQATTKSDILKIPTIIEGLDIELTIDKETHLPKSAQIKESDFLHGDVIFQINYDDWEQFTEVKFPKKLEYFFNEQKVKTETISNLSLNTVVSPTTFFTPEQVATPITYNEEVGKRGVYHSQWYNRLFDAGISIDMPLDAGFVAEAYDWVPFGIGNQTIGSKVKIIGRPDMLYWSVAIETSAGVLLVDAPLNQEWCNSIINAVKSPEGFPNSDITGVIVTHDHFDHFGGIRAMANEAQKVYVNPEGKENLQSILEATHSLVPDALSTNTSTIAVEEVNGVTTLDGGAVEIHNIDMSGSDNNPHSDNMLIVYVPEYELIIQADLFNAGGLVSLYEGLGAAPLNSVTKATWNNRAKFLLNYITEKGLTVSKVVGIHGGLGNLAQLQFVAQ